MNIMQWMERKAHLQLTQRYTHKKSLKKFGSRARQAARKEIKQLHDRKVFEPISIDQLTKMEKKGR